MTNDYRFILVEDMVDVKDALGQAIQLGKQGYTYIYQPDMGQDTMVFVASKNRLSEEQAYNLVSSHINGN